MPLHKSPWFLAVSLPLFFGLTGGKEKHEAVNNLPHREKGFSQALRYYVPFQKAPVFACQFCLVILNDTDLNTETSDIGSS